MVSGKGIHTCWKLPLFGIVAFLLAVNFAEGATQSFGRTVITAINKAQGELRIQSGGIVYLTPSTVIYGQGQKYRRNILRVGQSVQVKGVYSGSNITATRINVYESTSFWNRLNRH